MLKEQFKQIYKEIYKETYTNPYESKDGTTPPTTPSDADAVTAAENELSTALARLATFAGFAIQEQATENYITEGFLGNDAPTKTAIDKVKADHGVSIAFTSTAGALVAGGPAKQVPTVAHITKGGEGADLQFSVKMMWVKEDITLTAADMAKLFTIDSTGAISISAPLPPSAGYSVTASPNTGVLANGEVVITATADATHTVNGKATDTFTLVAPATLPANPGSGAALTPKTTTRTAAKNSRR